MIEIAVACLWWFAIFPKTVSMHIFKAEYKFEKKNAPVEHGIQILCFYTFDMSMINDS